MHPFNVEAPLSALFNEGFLTSPELFYVRNHGAVPEVADKTVLDWELSVEGWAIHICTVKFANGSVLWNNRSRLPFDSCCQTTTM